MVTVFLFSLSCLFFSHKHYSLSRKEGRYLFEDYVKFLKVFCFIHLLVAVIHALGLFVFSCTSFCLVKCILRASYTPSLPHPTPLHIVIFQESCKACENRDSIPAGLLLSPPSPSHLERGKGPLLCHCEV